MKSPDLMLIFIKHFTDRHFKAQTKHLLYVQPWGSQFVSSALITVIKPQFIEDFMQAFVEGIRESQ